MGRLPHLGRHQLAGPRHLCRALHAQENQSDDVVNGPYDLIGPPRPGSNLRPVKFAKNQSGESELAVRLRELRQETQKFNQEWWIEHNRNSKKGELNLSRTFLLPSTQARRTRPH